MLRLWLLLIDVGRCLFRRLELLGCLGGPGMCHICRILSYVSYTYAMPIIRRGFFDVSEQRRTVYRYRFAITLIF